MASIKKIKTSSQFNNNKHRNYYKEDSNNSENIKNNEENKTNNNYIEKSYLEELLKCELCDNVFDLNIHIPIVIKCGHTFCKNCVLNIYNNKYKEIDNSCPIDNMKNAFNVDSCLINLRVELLIKKIFQKQNNKSQKKIVYSKPDVKKVNQNVLSNEIYSNKKNGEYGYKKYEEINDNLNTPQIEDEINIDNKLPFEDEKIKGVMINETIDTIPLYDEKSFENVSFKEDVNELFEKKNIITNKKFIQSESNKKELNKNKYISKNDKKKDEEHKIKINNKNLIKPLTKLIPDLSLTPKKIKESKISKETPLENNYNYTDRNINTNEYIKRQIILENNNEIRNNIKIPELNKLIKIQKKLKENDDIIVLNKKEEEKENKDLYLNINNNYPSKKIILFSSTNNNKDNDNKDYNFNKLNTIQNLESNEKKLKMSLILNKNANILSTKILKNINTNTLEAKNINYEQLINSSDKRPKKIGRNYNESEAFTKNRTFNCKNEDNNSLLDLFNNSNKENKNNEKNKNIKVLNKSNNNNSSSYSNSNSNSIYNKKKIINDIKKEEKLDNNNHHKLSVTNSKSQNLLSIENIKQLDLNKDIQTKEAVKLKQTIDQKENNLISNSNVIIKKQKNTSPLIFSSKHFKKNKKNEINLNNEQKENTELILNENNIRRANSFITNNKVLIKKRKIEEKKALLENELNNLIKMNKNINIKHSIDIIKEIFEDKKYENDVENIKIKILEKNDLFIGIMDNNNKFPLKGFLFTHNGDFYNGEFSEGKKNGKGNIIYANGTKYEGSFKNDYHDGFGKLIQLNGETYEGEWKKGKINGNGMRIHANGNKYIGNYVNNIRNGNGHLIFVNGESYQGNFLNGKANGNGIFKFKNGNIYEGEFKDNLIMGKGTLTLKNGDKYIGFFTNGSINGKGTFINNNGEKYIGNFDSNKKNGYGKLYDKNGILIKEGIWEDGIYTNKK